MCHPTTSSHSMHLASLTKFSGSCSHALIAPAIFFLSSWFKFVSINIRLNYEPCLVLGGRNIQSKSIYWYQHGIQTMVATFGTIKILDIDKLKSESRIPVQNLGHIFLWVPSNLHLVFLGFLLGHRFLPKADEPILPRMLKDRDHYRDHVDHYIVLSCWYPRCSAWMSMCWVVDAWVNLY